jgi:putative transposase
VLTLAVRRSATKRHGLPSVVQPRLVASPEQAEALAAVVLRCNQAATLISRLAWQQRVFTVVELHRLAYYAVRAQVAGLGAQAAVRAIARVAGAYANRRASKKRAHIFRPQAVTSDGVGVARSRPGRADRRKRARPQLARAAPSPAPAVAEEGHCCGAAGAAPPVGA